MPAGEAVEIDMKRKLVQIGLLGGLTLLGFVTWLAWPYIPKGRTAAQAIEMTSAAGVGRSTEPAGQTAAPVADTDLSEPPPPPKEIAGIGAALKWDAQRGAPQIAEVLQNSPASHAGLAPGLIIQRIDKLSTQGMNLSACVNLIRGAVGTRVLLELLDPALNATNVVELTRQRVAI